MERIKAFFIHIITMITAFFYKLFHKEEKNKKEQTKIDNITKEIETKKEAPLADNTTLPDEPSTLSNPHNTETGEEAPNTVILELPKLKLDKIKQSPILKKELIITSELIDILIEQALEELEEHKKINFKIKDANKELKEKIKEFKEKVIPKINHSIEIEKPKNKEELKKIVKEVVKEQNKLTPLFPKKEEIITIKKETPKKVEKPKKEEIKLDLNKDKKEDVSLNIKQEKQEPYVMATILPEETLTLPEITSVKKVEKLATTVPETKKEIKEKAEERHIQMVPTTKELPKKKPVETIKQVATIAALTTIKAADAILISTPKETKEKIKEVPTIKKLDLPELKTIDDKIKQASEKKELDVIEEDLTYIDHKIKEKQEEIKEVEKETKEPVKKENTTKTFIDDSIIDNIEDNITKVTTSASVEMKKEELEDKNYDEVEKEIDKLIDEIDDTITKYKDTMPEVQLRKLEAEKAKLEQTEFSLDTQKKVDIHNERKHLDDLIHESEKQGLKKEIERLKFNHQMDLNNALINKVEDLNNMTQDQVERIEKVLIKKKMKDAYRAATITSMVAFPFVRTKYFFYFTAGMMVNTFFLQLHSVLSRKTEDLSLPDINSLQRGEDALNEAINVTNDNLVILHYLTEETLSKYPDLRYDLEYMRYVNGLQEKLTLNQSKLTRKKNNVDKLLHRSKKDIKQLKKVRKKEQERMAA
mgnify:CR=1 FL=1